MPGNELASFQLLSNFSTAFYWENNSKELFKLNFYSYLLSWTHSRVKLCQHHSNKRAFLKLLMATMLKIGWDISTGFSIFWNYLESREILISTWRDNNCHTLESHNICTLSARKAQLACRIVTYLEPIRELRLWDNQVSRIPESNPSWGEMKYIAVAKHKRKLP